MAKITYTSLGLKSNNEIKEIEFNGKKIEIKQYLPIEDKIDLIDITMQKSLEDNIYNPIKIDMYFHLHLIYLYTNLTFTDKQRENENKLYDVLNSSNFIGAVVEAIPETEYSYLVDLLNEKIEKEMTYRTTTAGVINNLITNLLNQTDAMSDIINNFDPEKYQAVLEFAKAANGNREIN